ncbi:glycosyltransferase family protein [Aureibacter tunicatorum]|uniref:Uncharacterized protein (TIGR00661 family) n=1 Tax=Aureibacter tunicatorum TaxID=866807 RepID=A0AAE3XPF5_9BACT|nr:glycosyltransferase family protein [Aureibacter tunicatorum]MDR6241641.1 uncharacterized protein (TIGR00661 family) [Aureibacter tunicatorum]BDD07372.1 glycosyl transferase [Aureibacter tunicatorum]
MKILYAIQGTGNGHISRARDIIPSLQRYGTVDVLVSGIQADVNLGFPVKYKCKGMGFIFGKKGGVDIYQTLKKTDFRNFFKEVMDLPVQNYDMVFNDFEPVASWACALKHKPSIGLSHQAAVISENAPLPDKSDSFGRFVLKNYAPVSKSYGFHFERYNDSTFTPVIRQEIRNLTPENHGHYTVYLPAYDDKRLIQFLSNFKDTRWEVFSKHNKQSTKIDNIKISPVNNSAFMTSLSNCEGFLCGAGFEGPAEALHLGKKVLAIPMKNQYEQHCNAASLSNLGVPTISSIKPKHISTVNDWIINSNNINVNYPDMTDIILDNAIEHYYEEHASYSVPKTILNIF